jgi:uncharacterized tellurite resistance protein B-like protein
MTRPGVSELKIALALHVAELIVDADHRLEDSEAVFLNEMFPPEVLAQAGFLDAMGSTTEKYAAARDEALAVLPELLSADEKLELITLFVHASAVDGEMDPRELAVMAQAATALGVPRDVYADHVTEVLDSGRPPPVLRTRPERIEPPIPDEGVRIHQTDVVDALDPRDEAGLVRRRAICAALRDPEGLVVLIASHEDVVDCDVSGWRALIELIHREGLSLSARGRLGVELEGFDGDPRPSGHIPPAREWLAWVQRSWPWAGTWVRPEHGGVQMVLALAPVEANASGAPLRTDALLSAAVWVANWGVGYARRLGSADESHARRLMAAVGITEVPSAFFEGSASLIDRLDARGLLVRDR